MIHFSSIIDWQRTRRYLKIALQIRCLIVVAAARIYRLCSPINNASSEPILVVWRDSVVSASLNVDCRQVDACEGASRLGEQVIPHCIRDMSVEFHTLQTFLQFFICFFHLTYLWLPNRPINRVSKWPLSFSYNGEGSEKWFYDKKKIRKLATLKGFSYF